MSKLDAYKNLIGEMNSRLASPHWKRRFSKKGVGFFFFIKEVCKYVKEVVVLKDHIPWADIPGYGIILKNFLVELKKRDVRTYPDALVESSESLLLNHRLLGVMHRIVLTKTK